MNFYQYACGGWMAANPMPADQSRWGRFNALRERNRTILQGILEGVSANKPGRTAIDFGVYGAPESFLIDARGVIRYKHIGPFTPEVIERELAPLIARLRQEAP